MPRLKAEIDPRTSTLKTAGSKAPRPLPQPGIALRRAFARGFTREDFKADLMAGAVVGVVALPLSMALAVASGVPPQHGLYTAIIGGFLIALLGGSRVQVSGPTAAFVAILAPISARFGLGGLALASAMAGVILIIFGFSRFGRLIEFVPHPVTHGFTAGIAIVIAVLQLKDLFGLTVDTMPHEFLDRLAALVRALPTTHWPDLTVGLATLAVLIFWPRINRSVPGPLVALTLAALAAWLASRLLPGFEVATIHSRFSYELGGQYLPGIPRLPPLPVFPWHLADASGQPVGLSLGLLRELLPAAFTIAILGAIESLLSAVVADGMIHGKHDPDEELIAQGVGNVVAPFFGGFAATGAIARTATNVRAGARSPLAAMIHAVVVLAAVLALAPVLGLLPMSALAALLLLTAWNMSEVRVVAHMMRIAPKSDVLVLLTCLFLTVAFDMVVAVVGGIVLAALLFMRRMAEVSGVELVGETHRDLASPLPKGVVLYEVAGPLFFGAAQRGMAVLTERIASNVKAVILDLRAAPALDATGLVALDSALDRLRHKNVFVALAGVQPQPFRALIKAGWRNRQGHLVMRRSFEHAVEDVRAYCREVDSAADKNSSPAVNRA